MVIGELVKDAEEQIRSGGFDPSERVRWKLCMKCEGVDFSHEAIQKQMKKGLRMMYGDKAVWKDEFDEVANWLCDNQGKGLFLMGRCGTGKTAMANHIIPKLLQYHYRLMCVRFDATELALKPDEVMQYHILVIDDVGTESESVSFGQRRQAFAELMDAAEKKGKLVILTSNLTMKELKEKYGDRVVDRIKGLTRGVVFKGESLRN